MRSAHRMERGFTLIEIIVVLGVLSALVAVLVPRVFIYVRDANVLRAQADANGIAAAINKMYEDTGRWPFYADGDGAVAHTSGTDAALLTSNPDCDLAPLEYAATCDDTVPADGTVGASWDLSTSLTDSLRNHLIVNRPGYPTTGKRAWQGPYIDAIPPVDPWDRSYLVNVANADPTAEGPAQRWVIVISAGPDGTLDSSADAVGTTDPTAVGDDIVARAK